MKIFAYSKWDAVAVVAGMLHFVYVLTFFAIFPFAPCWVLVCMGLLYSVSVSWNINGVSHNLIHNPFFKARLLNRLFSIMESVTLGISQPSTSTFITATISVTVTDRTSMETRMTGFPFTGTGAMGRRKIRGVIFS